MANDGRFGRESWQPGYQDTQRDDGFGFWVWTGLSRYAVRRMEVESESGRRTVKLIKGSLQ